VSRLTAMRVIAWLLVASGVGFSLFTIVFGFIGPNQEIHSVHNAIVVGLISVLTVPSLVVVARRPEDAAPELRILVALVVVGVAAMAISLTPDPFTVPVLVLIVAPWFLAPGSGAAMPSDLALVRQLTPHQLKVRIRRV
jgi:MFS family permease